MDVLQVMKEGHDGVRRAIGALESLGERSMSKGVPVAALEDMGKCLQLHLTVEGEYLCPEIEDRFPGSQVVVDIIKANHRVIRRVADDIWASARTGAINADGLSRCSELASQVQRHLDSVEKLLMPKLRQYVPTFEREELGEVIQDVIDERSGDALRFGRSRPDKGVKPTPKTAKAGARKPVAASRRRA